MAQNLVRPQLGRPVSMKFGMRKISPRKSFAARTKGRATRAMKRALIPGYGKRGMGIFHPRRKAYQAIYSRTTFSLGDLFRHR